MVDPSADFIGGEDIETVQASVDLQSGDIRLASPKHGYPLLNWRDVGINILFHGNLYHARLLRDNVPSEIWGDQITGFLRKTGYTATIDLCTLKKSEIEREQ